MKNSAVILIFVHKPTLEWYEKISLQQCVRVLGTHPIRLVCPEGMDIRRYREVEPDLAVDFISPSWLSSYEAYNRLKIVPFIYRRYSAYRFILTYELDSFVFRDDLLAWCEEGWDYIGAPWFEGYAGATRASKPIGVGNSGFSLRRTGTMLRVMRSLRYQQSPRELVNAWREGKRRLRGILAALTFRNNFFAPLNNYSGYEDTFWCQVVAPRFPAFRLAPHEIARRFSFECNPGLLYEQCGQTLPFGCHKWFKYEPKFWKPHIENFGYEWPEAEYPLSRPRHAAVQSERVSGSTGISPSLDALAR